MTEPQPSPDPAATSDDLVPPVLPGAGPPRPPITVPVGGDTFRIDVDRAPQAIRDLEDALQKLRDIRIDAGKMRQVTPPANDPVTRDVAFVLGAAAEGGSGSLASSLDAGRYQIKTLVKGLRAGLRRYENIDSAAAAGLDRAT